MDGVNLGRREISQTLLGLPLLGFVPAPVDAAATEKFDLHQLHQQAAKTASKLNQGNSLTLKLLLRTVVRPMSNPSLKPSASSPISSLSSYKRLSMTSIHACFSKRRFLKAAMT
jgi:hypothetical protein